MDSLPTFFGFIIVGICSGVTNAFMELAVKPERKLSDKSSCSQEISHLSAENLNNFEGRENRHFINFENFSMENTS